MMTFTHAEKRAILEAITRAVKDLESTWKVPFGAREKAVCQTVASAVLNLPSD